MPRPCSACLHGCRAQALKSGAGVPMFPSFRVFNGAAAAPRPAHTERVSR